MPELILWTNTSVLDMDAERRKLWRDRGVTGIVVGLGSPVQGNFGGEWPPMEAAINRIGPLVDAGFDVWVAAYTRNTWWNATPVAAWTNDAAWDDFAGNCADLARLTIRNGGLGIGFDNEGYPTHTAGVDKGHWSWQREPGKTEAEVRALVRARAQQVGNALSRAGQKRLIEYYIASRGPGTFASTHYADRMASSTTIDWCRGLASVLDVLEADAWFHDNSGLSEVGQAAIMWHNLGTGAKWAPMIWPDKRDPALFAQLLAVSAAVADATVIYSEHDFTEPDPYAAFEEAFDPFRHAPSPPPPPLPVDPPTVPPVTGPPPPPPTVPPVGPGTVERSRDEMITEACRMIGDGFHALAVAYDPVIRHLHGPEDVYGPPPRLRAVEMPDGSWAMEAE